LENWNSQGENARSPTRDPSDPARGQTHFRSSIPLVGAIGLGKKGEPSGALERSRLGEVFFFFVKTTKIFRLGFNRKLEANG